MRISIKYKLFLVILTSHFLVYLGMLGFGYFSFNKGFLEYVSRIDERLVPELVRSHEDFYMRTGSWDILSERRIWGDFIRQSIESSSDPELAEARRTLRPGPTVGITANDWYYTSEYSPARPYLHLLDVNQSIIWGDRDAFSDATTLNPIRVNGETVGYLGVTSRQQLSEQADLLFAQQQQNSYFWLFMSMVFVISLLAFPVAIYLTRPVMEVVGGTRSLTKGDYTSRIPVRGSDELGQLSADFNTLALTLEQNQTARQQWIADISHELRTPLSILQGEMESVEDGIRPLNIDTISSLHSEVIHLNALVNDLHELSMSDIGALVYAKEKICVSEILEHSVDLHKQTAAKQGLNINLRISSTLPDNSIFMLGDENRMQQLFDNLLQNSCRYTDTGGEVQIYLHQRNGNVTIEWFDSKPGVSDNDLQHLFERFYRVEASRNRAKGGSGLGLAICRNIIHAHDGTVTASHSPLGGLKLTISLPRRLDHHS